MISVIIPTRDAGRVLTRTLSRLTTAAVDGLVRAVIVIDCGSTDETLEIADDAGCEIVAGPPDRGACLALGAEAARSPWLMTLAQDVELPAGWEAAVAGQTAHAEKAGWFDRRPAGLIPWLRRPRDCDALMIHKALLESAGGFVEGVAEARLARQLPGRQCVRLSTHVAG